MNDEESSERGASKGVAPVSGFVAVMCFGSAALVFILTATHQDRAHDYEGLALLLASFTLAPLWIFCGIIALYGWAKTAFGIAIAPIIILMVLSAFR